jgi:hypothetical protein
LVELLFRAPLLLLALVLPALVFALDVLRFTPVPLDLVGMLLSFRMRKPFAALTVPVCGGRHLNVHLLFSMNK